MKIPRKNRCLLEKNIGILSEEKFIIPLVSIMARQKVFTQMGESIKVIVNIVGGVLCHKIMTIYAK